jgi:hypothetical protein
MESTAFLWPKNLRRFVDLPCRQYGSLPEIRNLARRAILVHSSLSHGGRFLGQKKAFGMTVLKRLAIRNTLRVLRVSVVN